MRLSDASQGFIYTRQADQSSPNTINIFYEHPEIVPFTQDQIKKLLSVCTYTKAADTNNHKSFMMHRPTAQSDHAIIFILLDTGIHARECARLLIKNVDIEAGTIFISPFGTGKKTKSRTVYFRNDTRRALWKYLTKQKPDPRDLLFLTDEGRPIDRNSLGHVLRRLGKWAGIPSIHPHRFRHSFAIEFLRGGGDVFTLFFLIKLSGSDTRGLFRF